MSILGYFLFFLMGATLGLIGAGGSILSIPILMYCFNMPIIMATSYALAIVGFTAFAAAMCRVSDILWKKSLLFAVPSAFGVFCARYFIIPHLPKNLGILSVDHLLVGLLILLMIFASYAMIRGMPQRTDKSSNYVSMFLSSVLIGSIIGLLGAGGGFLIIPALMYFLGFALHHAISSSLLIIAFNSMIGILSDQYNKVEQDIYHIIMFLCCALFGMLLGKKLSTTIPRKHLQVGFGWFILLLALGIAIKEFY